MTHRKHLSFHLCQIKSEQFLQSYSCSLSVQNTHSFNKLAHKCLTNIQSPEMFNSLHGVGKSLNNCNTHRRGGSNIHFQSEKNPME